MKTPTRPIQRYRQRNQAFNPYWNNPFGFIQVNQTPASNVVNDNDNKIENIVVNDNDNKIENIVVNDNNDNIANADNNNKMTIDDDKTKAIILRDEMQWPNKPNKHHPS